VGETLTDENNPAMSIAGRKSKSVVNEDATTWDRIEDLLTADVFGAYRYLPPQLGIVPFLRSACGQKKTRLSDYFRTAGLPLEDIAYARIIFWPRLGDGREPDLLVLLGPSANDLRIALLVEAKLNAKQHSIEGVDGVWRSQLGHYLKLHRKADYHTSVAIYELPPIRPILYVTRHNSIPTEELGAASVEADSGPEPLFWTNWQSAWSSANKTWAAKKDSIEKCPWLRVLLDLKRDLEIRGLIFYESFSGFSLPKSRSPKDLYSRSYQIPNKVFVEPTLYQYRRFTHDILIHGIADNWYINDNLTHKKS